MKYNKSMLRIYEFLLNNLGRGIIVEELIRNAKVGRTSGFEALEQLIKRGVVIEKKVGRQREISLKIDSPSLSFKFFFDAFRFKGLNDNLKLVASLLVEYTKGMREINAVLLFGSAVENNDYNDIDILFVCKEIDKKKILAFRNKLESVSSKVINIHFSEYISLERFAKSLCIRGFDYCIDHLIKNNSKESFMEAVEWLGSYKEDKNSFENLLTNLAFAYCYSEDLFPKYKEEAKSLLLKKYPVLNKNNIKGAVIEVGEKIFR